MNLGGLFVLDETKKDKILSSSLGEFAEYGFDKASTDRISRDAGVSKGLIFHYFGNKENLYMSTMNMCIDDIFKEYNNFKLIDGDFKVNLIKMMELKYDFFIKHPMHYKLMVNGFYNSPKKLQSKLDHRYKELKQVGISIIIDMIKDLPLKKDVYTSDIVSVLSSIANVLEYKYLLYFTDDTSSFEKFYDTVKDEYMRLMNIVLYGILD